MAEECHTLFVRSDWLRYFFLRGYYGISTFRGTAVACTNTHTTQLILVVLIRTSADLLRPCIHVLMVPTVDQLPQRGPDMNQLHSRLLTTGKSSLLNDLRTSSTSTEYSLTSQNSSMGRPPQEQSPLRIGSHCMISVSFVPAGSRVVRTC